MFGQFTLRRTAKGNARAKYFSEILEKCPFFSNFSGIIPFPKYRENIRKKSQQTQIFFLFFWKNFRSGVSRGRKIYSSLSDLEQVSKRPLPLSVEVGSGRVRSCSGCVGRVNRLLCAVCRSALSRCHNRRVRACVLQQRSNLHGSNASRATLQLELQAAGVEYQPGDHVGVFAINRPDLVDGVIAHLQQPVDPDKVVELQLEKESHTSNGERKGEERRGEERKAYVYLKILAQRKKKYVEIAKLRLETYGKNVGTFRKLSHISYHRIKIRKFSQNAR